MLKNIVDPSDLICAEEYSDLKEDISEECAKFGALKSLEMPRPADNPDCTAGIGHVFLEYCTVEDAKEARRVQGC